MAYDRNRRRGRRKVCAFCVDKVEKIDYKDTARKAKLFRAAQRKTKDRSLKTSVFFIMVFGFSGKPYE